jgi:O-acetylserine/cysteine efflux transporter
MRPRHVLLGILVTAIWGGNFSLIKLSLGAVDPLVLAGIRFTLCAFPAVLFVRRPTVALRFVVAYGLVFGIAVWGLVNLSMATGQSAGISALLLQFSALGTVVLGCLVFRESLTVRHYLGIGTALLGLACVTLVTDGTVTAWGVVLVLCGAIGWSMANLIIKVADPKEGLAFLLWSSAFSPLPLFALSWLVHGTAGFTQLTARIDLLGVVGILFQVYVSTIVGYGAWNWLLRQYPLSTVAPISLLVPVFGILGSMLIFGERVPPLKLLAILLIVGGVIVTVDPHQGGTRPWKASGAARGTG